MNAFIKIRRDLHRIPELGFEEFKTQKYILNYVNDLENVEVKTWKTGILVRIQGKNPSKTIGYRADIDGLPIQEENDIEFRSTHEGKMHACGHDVHTSIALGILTHFSHNPIEDNLLFIFQPAEEYPGGAQPLFHSEIFKAWKPDIIMALHIAPELPVGTISTKVGPLFANSTDFNIKLKGQSGHGAYPHLTKDMVLAVSHLITQLHSIVSRNIDPKEQIAISIGRMESGIISSIVAEHARIEGTIRYVTPSISEIAKRRIENILKGIELSFECETFIEYPCDYYFVNNSERETNHFINFIQNQKHLTFVPAQVAMTAEDFGFFLKEIPGFMFWLGVDSPSALHTPTLRPNEKAIPLAIETLVSYIRKM